MRSKSLERESLWAIFIGAILAPLQFKAKLLIVIVAQVHTFATSASAPPSLA